MVARRTGHDDGDLDQLPALDGYVEGGKHVVAAGKGKAGIEPALPSDCVH